ncbi:MAG: YifB family Mg chelatase-like AAA ATPase [Clostridia bacterium]|nr:YifB family Mg chelatase-like AAA ATPase [Clostridia bacterium]
MLSIIYSTALQGLEGYTIRVETYIANGLPCFEVVGLGDTAVKESRERVKAAIKNSGYQFPGKRVIVNLAPGDLRKEGVVYDLAIAVGILAATVQLNQEQAQQYSFLGELSLNGEVRPVPGVLPQVLTAREQGFERIIVPKENADEAALVAGMQVYPVTTLKQVGDFLNGLLELESYSHPVWSRGTAQAGMDFAEVKGQFAARRAMEIAAAGRHNLLMVGSPGSGKTLLARCLPGIMPPLVWPEALETAKIYSLAGKFGERQQNLLQTPFRAPHHTASTVSLTGGGKYPRPGEISLAHNGILFLDEMPEFQREALEALRQPLEDGRINIARINASSSFPARLMLLGACNPCPCGYYGDQSRECRCSENQVRRYLDRISGPLLDRIDLMVYVPRVDFAELNDPQPGESSAVIRERVIKARQIQLERAGCCNSVLFGRQMRQFCRLDAQSSALLESFFKSFKLTARSHDKILRIARTIADLAGSPQIAAVHLAEAVKYRSENKLI